MTLEEFKAERHHLLRIYHYSDNRFWIRAEQYAAGIKYRCVFTPSAERSDEMVDTLEEAERRGFEFMTSEILK
jgi:hypothetical protein